MVQPDIVIICDEDKVNEYGRYEGTPTLIVEVLSPTTKGKTWPKLQLYKLFIKTAQLNRRCLTA
ncbi:MAG: prevent-host-death family protein [Bacillota bacterium]|nr:MAG: prevent-host-death family protein [Bacillota bacterium]